MPLSNKQFLDLITFSRASTGTRVNAAGVIESIAANQPRFDYEPVDVPVLGAELVTSGFNSGWSAQVGFAFSAGTLSVNAGGGATTNTSGPISAVGKTYLLTINVSSFTSGLFSVNFGGASSGNISSAGVKKFKLTPTSAAQPVIQVTNGGTVFSLLSISIKEITGYNAIKGDSKGLLIEEQRTNLINYSIPQTPYWQVISASVTNGAEISPDGAMNYALITSAISGSSEVYKSSIPVINGNTYTATIVIKPGTYYGVVIFGSDTVANNFCYFNLATGVVTPSGNASGSFSELANGSIKLTCTFTAAAASIALILAMNAASVGSSIYAWGAQLEAGVFGTSYIPTSGAQVTRAADVCSINTLAPVWNASEGTLVVGYDTFGGVAGAYPYQVSVAAPGGNDVTLYHSGSNGSAAQGSISGVSQIFIGYSAYTPGATRKTALAFKANDAVLVVNGATVGTDNSLAVPSLSKLCLGGDLSGNNALNGHLRTLKYFPKRISTAQLQALTA